MKSTKRISSSASNPKRKRFLITAETSLYKRMKMRMVEEDHTISQWFAEQAVEYLKRTGG